MIHIPVFHKQASYDLKMTCFYSRYFHKIGWSDNSVGPKPLDELKRHGRGNRRRVASLKIRHLVADPFFMFVKEFKWVIEFWGSS
jgi:hypothetical protein